MSTNNLSTQIKEIFEKGNAKGNLEESNKKNLKKEKEVNMLHMRFNFICQNCKIRIKARTTATKLILFCEKCNKRWEFSGKIKFNVLIPYL